MKIVSNEQLPVSLLGLPITSLPCPICDKMVDHSVHTEYGYRFVCEDHTDEELAKYERERLGK